MTTAHRPTWNTAKGGSEQGGNLLVEPSRAYSSKDLPAHLKLKSRQIGQGAKDEQAIIDFKQDLLDREAKHAKNQGMIQPELDGEDFKEPLPVKRQKINETSSTDRVTPSQKLTSIIPQYESSSEDEEEEDEVPNQKAGEHSDDDNQINSMTMQERKIEQALNEESEEDLNENQSDEDDDDEESEEDDSENEEELWREFNKIKQERALEREKKEQEKIDELKKREMEEIASGNPLLTSQLNSEFNDTEKNSYSLKRKWNEETVFKNQARTAPETKKRFINDTVRNDYHRKFMNKYLQ